MGNDFKCLVLFTTQCASVKEYNLLTIEVVVGAPTGILTTAMLFWDVTGFVVLPYLLMICSVSGLPFEFLMITKAEVNVHQCY